MSEIVIDWGLVTVLTVPVGWVAVKIASFIAGRFGAKYEAPAKKFTVYAVATGLAYWFTVQAGPSLPPIADDPAAFVVLLLGVITLAFKVAQQIYDRFWQKLPVVGAARGGLGAG